MGVSGKTGAAGRAAVGVRLGETGVAVSRGRGVTVMVDVSVGRAVAVAVRLGEALTVAVAVAVSVGVAVEGTVADGWTIRLGMGVVSAMAVADLAAELTG